jgi:hypothetical protein
MIVFQGTDDSLILYKQMAHAAMAGQIAKAWKRPDHIAQPLWDRLVQAIDHHDDGWLSHDNEPTLDEHGQPHDFKFMPMHQHREIWRRSIALAMGRDWLAGLLTTMYAKDLYVSYGQHGDADQAFINELGDVTSRTIQDAIKRGSEDSKIVAPVCLSTLMSMFTFWDGLSLTLLGGLPWQADWQYDDGRSMLHVKKLCSDAFAISPWPLVEDELTMTVQGMQLSENSWEDRESFHHAISIATPVVSDVHLRQN